MTVPGPTTASVAEPRLSRSDVLARCEYFSQVGVWPPPRVANPGAWLENFTDSEQEVAVALLNALVHFNEELTDALVVAAVRGLAPQITNGAVGYHAKRALWIEFLTSVRLTHVRSAKDDADETKSGFLFVRKARQQLALPSEQVLPAAEVLAAIAAGDERPVIIVDDFAGTGETFLEGWERPYENSGGDSSTFAQQAAAGARIYFCPALCAADAKSRIEEFGARAPFLSPAHFLPREMSVVHPDSEVIPGYLRGDVEDVVRSATARAGTSEPVFGYGGLGLALSFAHGTPDATLPIFYCEDLGWTPLVRRR